MTLAEKKAYLRKISNILIFLIIPLLGLLTYRAGDKYFNEIVLVLLSFNGTTQEINLFSGDLILLCGVFILISLFITSIISLTRTKMNNFKPEMYTMISGIVIFSFFYLFSYPLMMSWAHFHGYHVDHYEHARKGGWYIFKLNEAPVASAIQSDPANELKTVP